MSLTMAQGMKRLGMPIAALIGVALIGLISTSWFLDRDALRQAVEAQIRAVTGLDLVIKGNIDVSVFPGSYVSFHDVGLTGGGSNWTPFIDTIARAMKPGADNQVSFSEIRIQDGALSYEDAASHLSEKLGDIDLSLAWPSISRSLDRKST